MSVSQPPTAGPMAGAKVMVRPKTALATARWLPGMRSSMMVKAVGISTPPVKPWPTRNRIISLRFEANPHSTEKPRNSSAFTAK